MKIVHCMVPVLVLTACGGSGGSSTTTPSIPPSPDVLTAEPFEELSGGETTVFKTDGDAFSLSSANMSVSRVGRFSIGNRFFTDGWQIAPGSAGGRDGLGPLFNVASCQGCHIKDGRGHAPKSSDDVADSLLLRLSIPARNADEQSLLDQGLVAAIGDPVYGGQLQDHATPLSQPEGTVRVTYQMIDISFDDGTTVTLRKPTFSITDLNYGEMSPDIQMSARVAQPMIGLGLLEAIPEEDILLAVDEQDADGDGISGRTNRVFDAINQQPGVLGRFGWKAIHPTVKQQSAGAFNGDIGITSDVFTNENCGDRQTDCALLPSGGSPEVSSEILNDVDFYSRNLAVPARRDVDNVQVLAGKKLFVDSGCSRCHRASYTLPALNDDRLEQSGQRIFPYTDMLLHDMGEGLADNHSEFLASGSEWRTPPLWGIGLTQVVNSEATFLHDGRARTLMEAVLWHDGEAAQARQAVLGFDAQQRAAFTAFLESL